MSKLAKTDSMNEILAALGMTEDDVKSELAQDLQHGMTRAKLLRIAVNHRNGKLCYEGESDEFESLTGTIVWFNPSRAWFEGDEAGGFPACFSNDGIEPHPSSQKMQSATCANCQKDQFGSGPNRSKACNTNQNVFFLPADRNGVYHIRLSVKSIAPLETYIVSVISNNIPYFAVETKITGVTQKGNYTYATLTFETVGTIKDAERLAKIKSARQLVQTNWSKMADRDMIAE